MDIPSSFSVELTRDLNVLHEKDFVEVEISKDEAKTGISIFGIPVPDNEKNLEENRDIKSIRGGFS